MSWTYTNNPGGNPRDALRLAVGDTNENDQHLSDEEVNHFLILYPHSANLAAAEAAEAIAARLMGTSYAGDPDNSPAKRAEHFLKLAQNLRSREKESEVGEEEEKNEMVAKPGYSSAALNREALFKREVGYG